MPRSLEVQIVKAARKVVAILDEHRADLDVMDEICEIMNGNTKHWARDNGPLDEAMARYIVRKADSPKAV
jgi:hypothetical protein